MRIPPEHFLTKSLKAAPRGEQIAQILASAIDAVDPERAIHNQLKRDDNTLTIGQQTYNLDKIRRVFLVAFGKASLPMTKAAADTLGDQLTKGVIITKAQETTLSTPHPVLRIFQASHPVPDQRGVAAAQHIIELLQSTNVDDLVLFLISGGGSALLTAPVETVSLDDIQTLNRTLLACGADIGEINTLRKHLSRVKGGNLARQAHPAQTVSLILSDVIGDPLDVIASGPTVPDPTTYQDAVDILDKYDIRTAIPRNILQHLERGTSGAIADTPKEGETIFVKVQNIIVGNNLIAAQAAQDQAQKAGYNTVLLTTRLKGEARIIGPALAAIAQQIDSSEHPIPRPACIIAGGETTVTLQGDGLGGRNQELALSTVGELAGLQNTCLIALATDGDDGPTDAAGAVVTGKTLEQARLKDLNPAKFLSSSDAYHFFDPLDDLLKPGPTLTNVNDLTFIFMD